ncbi:MAG: sulfatase [Kiritimatiellales bacterium]|nr:sulfatase [Kiritimatiellales bacterium]MCF7864454.1 sulfatase [Kiritimatiellales bacterium]
MKRRCFIQTVGATALCSTVSAKGTAKPNVLFIIADDLNDNLGCYGNRIIKTPNIDRLAREGRIFRDAYTNFPLCGPSRNCFMSGLYPDQTGLYDLNTLLRERAPDVVTMSQHFMNNGYVAARVGKIFHYGNPGEIGTPGHDDPASWNETVNPRGRDKDEENLIHSIDGDGKKGFGARLSWLAADGTDEEQTDGIVATESIRLIKKYAAAKQPFFLGVGFYKPHTPYVSPKKYFDMYDPKDMVVPQVPDGYFDTLPEPAQKTLHAHKTAIGLSDEMRRTVIRAYYAAISFLDAQVGRVLQGLDEAGLKDNTVVLFTSDHGYHMGEHDHFQKMTLFENAGRVPLIISAPGMPQRGTETRSFAEMIDFYPTFSDLAGLPKPAMVSGVSLAPVVADPSVSVRESTLTQMPGGYTVRAGNYRYTKWGDGGPDMIEFYDRSTDPEEMTNQADNPEYRDQIARMDALLEERVRAAKTLPPGLRRLYPKPAGKKAKK